MPLFSLQFFFRRKDYTTAKALEFEERKNKTSNKPKNVIIFCPLVILELVLIIWLLIADQWTQKEGGRK